MDFKVNATDEQVVAIDWTLDRTNAIRQSEGLPPLNRDEFIQLVNSSVYDSYIYNQKTVVVPDEVKKKYEEATQVKQDQVKVILDIS